jgi:TonB family protein
LTNIFFDNQHTKNALVFISLFKPKNLKKMKNLLLILLAFTFGILKGCVDTPPKNVVEETTIIETSTVQADITPSVYTIQKSIFEYKPSLTTLHTAGFAPPLVTIDSNENPISENIFTKKSQFFTIKTDVETIVKGAEGATLTIPKDCFVSKTGNILRGDIKLELKEYMKTSDMVLANLVTQSNEKLLETGGMIYLNVTDKDGNIVNIRNDKNIKITLPRSSKSEDKQLFYGDLQANGRINWALAKPKIDSFTSPIFTIVEQNPEFPNGQAALFQYIKKRLVYPTIARENRIEGTVYVNFTVMTNGQIANPRILRGIGAGCNEVALDIVRLMPRWNPARNQGGNVAMSYTLPIKFRLSDDEVSGADALIAFKADSMAYIRDSAMVNRFVEIQNVEEYVMRTQRLGWINCDRFLSLQNTQKTDFVVWHNKPDAEIRLVFKNFRSIMASWANTEKKATFAGVPIGQPVFIVATSPEDGKFNISVTETVIGKDQSTTIVLKTVEKEAFLRELHRLDLSDK